MAPRQCLLGVNTMSRQRGSNRTILYQDCEALLHQQSGIKDNQAKTQRQYIVTRPDLEEISNSFLRDGEIMSAFDGWHGFFGGMHGQRAQKQE